MGRFESHRPSSAKKEPARIPSDLQSVAMALATILGKGTVAGHSCPLLHCHQFFGSSSARYLQAEARHFFLDAILLPSPGRLRPDAAHIRMQRLLPGGYCAP